MPSAHEITFSCLGVQDNSLSHELNTKMTWIFINYQSIVEPNAGMMTRAICSAPDIIVSNNQYKYHLIIMIIANSVCQIYALIYHITLKDVSWCC